jgi:hypothetical protein
MNAQKFILILFSIFNSFVIPKLVKEKVILAINCGGEEFEDSDGLTYQKDQFYDAGIASDHGLNYDVSGTKDMEVYQTERWHSDTLTYSLPIKEPGKYVIILKFSEVYFSAPEEKVFDVAVGKKIVIKDLDIFAKVGKAAAHDEFIEFELKDDRVFINKSEAPGAYDAKNKVLKLRFVKGSKDNPKINAIIVLKGTIYDTDFAEKKRHQDEANRKKLQEAKKQILVQLRHHPDEIYDEDAVLNDESDSILTKDDGGLFDLFFSIHGGYIFLSLGLFFALNYILDVADKKSSSAKLKF